MKFRPLRTFGPGRRSGIPRRPPRSGGLNSQTSTRRHPVLAFTGLWLTDCAKSILPGTRGAGADVKFTIWLVEGDGVGEEVGVDPAKSVFGNSGMNVCSDGITCLSA